MDKIIEFINNKTNNKYNNLLFFGGRFIKALGTMQLTFSTLGDEESYKLINENVSELSMLCKEYFANNIVKDVKVVLKSNNITMQELIDCVRSVISSQFKLSNVDVSQVTLSFDDDKTSVIIPYLENSLDVNEIDKYSKEIATATFEQIRYEVTPKFVEIHSNGSSVLNARKERLAEDSTIFEDIKNSQVVDITNVKALNGEFGYTKATLAGKSADSDVIVGHLKSATLRESKPKENEKETSYVKKFYVIELEYDGFVTRCYWFLPKGSEELEIKEGETIAVYGKFEQFNGRYSFRVASIATCEFIPPKKVWRKCPSEYRYIKPEPYEFVEQTNFLIQEKKTENKYLLENTFVVYDLETTGISPENCKIIDIGAFKIVDGKITEKFSTFVDPLCEIPEEATKVNRITNAMVENSPTIEMALPDFYKFCYGSTIVGYNNKGFDDLFIEREGKLQLFNFDNKKADVFEIAKNNIFGLHNYKLGTVCAYENVPLIDAHRATNDALATAKLFIKLVEKYL